MNERIDYFMRIIQNDLDAIRNEVNSGVITLNYIRKKTDDISDAAKSIYLIVEEERWTDTGEKKPCK